MLGEVIRWCDDLRFGNANFAEGLRWINLGLAAYLIGKAFNLILFYARIRNRAQSNPLVWHVVFIALSYLLLLLFASADSVLRMEHGFSVRILVKMSASVLAIIAFRMMNLHLKYERNTIDYILSVRTSCPYCGSGFVARYCATCGKRQPDWKD